MDSLTEAVQPVELRPLNILILENVLIDAELMKQALRKGGVDFIAKRVGRCDTFGEMLDTFKPDVVLASSVLPDFTGRDALDHVRRMHPEVPVVMVTEALGEIAAVDWGGAKGYALKDDLRRLPVAMERAISAEQDIRAGKDAETALAVSEVQYCGCSPDRAAAKFNARPGNDTPRRGICFEPKWMHLKSASRSRGT
jgi:CheY-like chemotaxis protein